MKTDNKKFFDADIFIERVAEAMRLRGIGYKQLCEILNNKVGYEVTQSNLKIYINQRTPNIQFALALSEALGVSLDYMFGIDEKKGLIKGINHEYDSSRYEKYKGSHYLYFFNTVNNTPHEIKPAIIKIEYTTKYEVTMEIETTEGNVKIYKGEIQISDVSPNVFMTLYADFGEAVSMCFYQQAVNFAKFQCAVGAMLSVSTGNLHRAPVFNRFIMTSYEVPEDKMKYVYANLRLNSKYIKTEPSVIDSVVKGTIADRKLADAIIIRLKNAFCEKKYHEIQEQYISDTIKRDYNLSYMEAEDIIAGLRNQSFADINSKINRCLDATLFECTRP